MLQSCKVAKSCFSKSGGNVIALKIWCFQIFLYLCKENSPEIHDSITIKYVPMKKFLLAFVFAVSMAVAFSGCTLTEERLAEKIKSAMVDDEKTNGKTLEVTDFDLGQKVGDQYKGVLKGRLDGQEVTYDVVVTDEGNDYDIDWEMRE